MVVTKDAVVAVGVAGVIRDVAVITEDMVDITTASAGTGTRHPSRF